jgi:site-specific DNA-methyltransferase (adenine-specific)
MDNLKFENADACYFLPQLDSNICKLVLTDPPYLVSRKTGFSSIGGKGVDRFRVSMDFGDWDKITNGEHVGLLTTVFKECYRVIGNGGIIIVFYDIWKLESLVNILKSVGFTMFRFVEWVKTNPVPLNSRVLYLSNAREAAVVAVKGCKPLFKSSYHNGIFSMPIHRDGGKRLHPTQKPLSLMKQLIEIHTNKGDIVVDPFSGSGTTLLAALQLDRLAYGCEIDKIYFDKAMNRIRKLHVQD